MCSSPTDISIFLPCLLRYMSREIVSFCNGNEGIVVDGQESEACGASLRSVDELHVFPSHFVHGVSGD